MKTYIKKGGILIDGLASFLDDMTTAERRRVADEILAGTSQIVAYAPTNAEKKQTALASVVALGFTLEQIRVLRSIVMLATGTPAQKLAAQNFLAPIIQVFNDAKNIGDAIDLGAVPPVFVPPTIQPDP